MRIWAITASASICLACVAVCAPGFTRKPAPPSSSQAAWATRPIAPTFYRDVLPILQTHCQVCHRAEGIAPVPLETYRQAAEEANTIAGLTRSKAMPPWFADPSIGRFSDDPSLTAAEIATLTAWAEGGAPPGDEKNAPAPRNWTGHWNIRAPDDIVSMPEPVKIPASGEIEYTYEIVPTGFAMDKWVQAAQVLPSQPQYVHHAVVYIRPPDSTWLRSAPVNRAFTASSLTNEQDRRDAHWTDSDILLVYAPGSSPDDWPATMAKFIPAGSDLVFQIHYTANGHAGDDQSSIGLIFAKSPPHQRVLTLQLTNDRFVIPPGVDDFRVEAHGTLPNDATLLSFFPHMHLRGKRFEYNIVRRDGHIEPLLRVDPYHFHWQMSYRLAQPIPLKAGTMLQAVGWYDNSAKNPHNPDPAREVRWGDQTSEEMMVGFFDAAVAANLDKWRFFVRHPAAKTE